MDQLDRAMAASVAEAHAGTPPGARDALPRTAREGEQQVMEERLVKKLFAAGQLRPAYLVRALREGRLGLFTAALAALGRFETAHVKAALDSDRPELLALACVAIGIDRSVFPDILAMARRLNDGLPGGGAEGARKAAVAFAPVSPEIARVAFGQAVRALRTA
jgi:uncharacterized protein (DUF2336 family)